MKREMTGHDVIKADVKQTPKKVVIRGYGKQLFEGPDNCGA